MSDQGMSYGYACWNFSACGEESRTGESFEDVEVKALVDGWKMGLDREGQAHYSCVHCTGGLFNVIQLLPTHWPGDFQLLNELRTGAWYVNTSVKESQ